MLILTITDIHGNRKVCRKLYEKFGLKFFDLVIVNGDITDFHGSDLAELILSMLSRLGKKTLFVPGNCDHPNLLNIEELGGAVNIHKRVLEVDGYSIFGYGGSILTPFNTWIEFDDNKIREDMKKLQNLSILVAHNPPYKTKIDKTWMGRHVGSKALREFIEIKQPVVSLHGHIHEARGVDKIGNTTLVNPGPLRSKYYAIIELSDSKLKRVELSRLD